MDVDPLTLIETKKESFFMKVPSYCSNATMMTTPKENIHLSDFVELDNHSFHYSEITSR